MLNWEQYINHTKNKAPRNLLVRAIEFVKDREAALDLGAGALNDSKYLLKSVFKKVMAVDNEKNSELLDEINTNEIYKRTFSFKKTKIEDYNFPLNFFDLINAQFVLPFLKRDKIGEILDKIKNSLKVGGIFTGQFFGVNDSWNNNPDVSVHAEPGVKELLSGLDIIYFQEEEKDGQTAINGQKHWHLFHFIGRKG